MPPSSSPTPSPSSPQAPARSRSRRRSRTPTGSEVSIGGRVIHPGQRETLELPVARLPTQTPLHLPVMVVNGRHAGPRLWLSAAIHGDELNGMEIIHRVLEKLHPNTLRGELIAAPIVNVFGFIHQDRYLPDRRDLNRSFPGSKRGSLASQLARLFMDEIVGRCTHGIDLHTASNHRTNLPQVRANLTDPEARRCAEAFSAPIMIHGEAPRGSLRDAVNRRKVPIVVYEAGEPHRFNPEAIDLGVKGILRVMNELGMRRVRRRYRSRQSMEAKHRTWVRAKRGGILRLQVKLGRWVSKHQSIAVIHDAFGEEKSTQLAPCDGLVIGHTNNPLVNQGDGIIHIARDVTTHGL